jgi:hypothetical protein
MERRQIIIAALTVLVSISLAGCSSSSNIDFGGYYYSDNEITSLTSGESSIERSWIRIIPREDGGYDVTGRLIGLNYHICQIIGEDGNPLLMKVADDVLMFTGLVALDVGQAPCSLMISVDGEDLVLIDPGNNCARWLFCAGAGISMNDYRFPITRYQTRSDYEQLELEQ